MQLDDLLAEFIDFASFISYNRSGGNAWRLQVLTDISKLPDYESGYYGRYGRYGYSRGSSGAPVDKQGNPVYHHIPGSYKTAKSDGERWRWLLEQTVAFQPGRRDQIDATFAGFLASQFGVQTMRSYGFFFGRQEVDDTKKNESGPYALHTLAENETIAKLANGIKRFKLPAEFDFIRIYKRIGWYTRTRKNTSANALPGGRSISSRAKTTSMIGSPSQRPCRNRGPICSSERWITATPPESSCGSPTPSSPASR